jgi:hypothetical protein
MLLWMAFAGAVPERWLWLGRMAARALRLDDWKASVRLAGVSRPEEWNAMVRSAVVMQGNTGQNECASLTDPKPPPPAVPCHAPSRA